MSTASFHTTCCVVGGGPAGVILGYLLARSGVKVTILEKHQDFFRDFRGDTVHPSTLELLHELDLLGKFLQEPHQKVTSVGVKFGDFTFEVANFRKLQTYCRFAVIMPQWDFLNFLSKQGKKYSTFGLRMQHEAIDLLHGDERIRGVLVRTPSGTEQIEADLVVACDGRHSVMRTAAQLPLRELGVPIDVLWFRISRREDDREQVLGNIDFGKMLVLISRNDYFQAGLIIRKNSFEEIKQRGLASLRKDISQIAPFLSERVGELKDWTQIQLLSVQINRLKRWHMPGLLCIGDAAHAMSPVFGIGINLAIQDAVAAANLLASALREGRNVDHSLYEVQRRRAFRTRLTQALQVIAHTGFQYVFRRQGPLHASWPLRLVARAHVLQPILLRVVGIGTVPEHVGPAAASERRIGNRVATLIGMSAGIAAAVVVGWRGLRAIHTGTQRSR